MPKKTASHPKGEPKEKKCKCPLCPKRYFDARTLKRHIVNKHNEEKDLPHVVDATKSREEWKEECPYCGKRLVEVRKHKCPQSSREHPKEMTSLSNYQFIQLFKARLNRECRPKTASAYISALKVPSICYVINILTLFYQRQAGR